MKETLKDVSSVLVPNGTVIGVVTFTDIEAALKVGLLLASLIYTIGKIVYETRKFLRELRKDE